MEKMHSDDLNTIKNLATVTLAEMYVDIIENEVGSCPVDDCSIHQCDFCNYGATSSSILEVHIMGDHADNLVEQIVNFDEYQFNCKSCIFGSNNEAEITEHTRKKHERQEMFPCNVCGVMFGFEVALDDHVRRNHMTEPITDAYDVAADKASTEVSESPLGNDAPKESLSNHYLAAILEQNIELFDKIACLTNVINKLDTNQSDLWDEVNKINKTNDDILNNQKYIQNDVSILATSAKNLHDDVSRVSASINGLHDQNHTSMNQNKATLSLMKEIIDNKPASGATVPHSMGHKNSSPVFPDTTFKCHICGKLFESTTCLKNHIETMHPRKPESDIQVIPIPCSKCDFKAHTGVQMKKHMQVRHFSDRKLLYVGDSVTMNVNFGLLERETQTAIRAAEASGTDADSTGNNAALIDVLDLELEREKFNFLVIAAGPTEISKLQVNQPSDAKLLREETVDIAKKVISIAEAALEKFPHLEKVILVRTTPRFDPLPIDPAQLKPQLALLADSVLFGLWCESMYKEKIVLGNHDLSEWSKHNHPDIYGLSQNIGYDGVHMSGRLGRTVLTRSLLSVLKTDLIKQTVTDTLDIQPYNPMGILRERILSHRGSSNPQTQTTSTKYPVPPSSADVPIPTGIAPPSYPQIQPRRSVIFTAPPSSRNLYPIPVHNSFEVLGNC